MEPNNLLEQLSQLEKSLGSYSFDSLTGSEARELKVNFSEFRDKLEHTILGNTAVKLDVAETRQQSGLESELKLIATVSHELRTPLNGIMGFTELLEESPLSREQLLQVHAIKSASQGLMNIINELLEYSKLTAGLEHFEKVNFNLRSLVKEVNYLCDTLILDKNITLDVSIDRNIPSTLLGDPSKLTQVLLNLLGNSIKFVTSGNIGLHIELLDKQGDELQLQFIVSDTGVGIAPKDLEHIFTAFRQGGDDLEMRYSGTGLGLSIVKQIIDQMNGSIRVESTLNEGTRFYFTLPFRIGQRTRKKKRQSLNMAALKGLRVLVFEDNPLNQKMIEQRLRSYGCIPYITENARYGLQLLEDKFVDLVLMDLCMPVMDGFKVTRIIRQHENENIRKLPIIAVTADYSAKDKTACEQAGMNDFLLKPFKSEELIEKILRLKGKSEGAAQETTAAIPETPPVNYATDIDLEPILEDCMGQLDMLEDLIQLFRQNALEFIGMVKIHLEHSDFDAVAKACHKIKCGLRMFQTRGLQELVEQIHRSARTEPDLAHMKNLLELFTTAYPEVEAKLKQALNDLKNSGQ